MVLLNGVKYACERCIRGHRVSSCTHTDKPLTMIKPKGRPASQCLHCREQRKSRGAHISCVCGKKGKSPGQHFASCLCHKNSSCTCSKEKKPKKKKHEGEELQSLEASEEPHMIIEDIAIPFEAEFGLLDCFSPNSFGGQEQLHSNEIKVNDRLSGGSKITSLETPQSLPPTNQDLDRGENETHNFSGLTNFANPPSDAELDIMENMFPLFPLVGSSSFSDSSSLPLSAISKPKTPRGEKHESPLKDKNISQNFNRSNSAHNSQISSSQMSNSQMSNSQMSNSQMTNSQMSSGSHISHQTANPLSWSESQSTQSNPYTSQASTHQPKPLRASASFDGTVHTSSALHNLHGSNPNLPQSSRPRRPESALSVTSSSSNTSKQNLLEHANYNLPKASSSAAFPPFNLSENNSNDDFSSLSYPSVGVYNESRSLSLASDDDNFKNLHSVTTPLPSRQPSQSRRKSSLTRSSQAHHTVPQALHTAFGKEKANSCDSSPYQANTCRSPSVDQQKLNRIDTYLREVVEESAPPSLSPGALPTPDAKNAFRSLGNLEQSKDLAFDMPMYSELLEYTPN